MENQGYPESNEEQLNDQGALANRQAAGFEPGNRDVLGENLQTDVSDVGARGGRASIGRTEAVEHGLGMAGQDAEQLGTGARQTRSDLPPSDDQGMGGLTFGQIPPDRMASDELDDQDGGEMGGYIDEGIEQVRDDMGIGSNPGASDVEQAGGNPDDVLWGVKPGTGNVGHGAEQTLGGELDATNARAKQPDDALTDRFSRNQAPMGENLEAQEDDGS